MRFARIVFLAAGIYGLLVTLALFFLETRTGIDYPPPVTHPEFYYGFAGVTAAWQVLFIAISRDPLRFRPLMPVCVLEKGAMVVLLLVLLPQGRFPSNWYPGAVIDILLGILFLVSFFRLGGETRGGV